VAIGILSGHTTALDFFNNLRVTSKIICIDQIFRRNSINSLADSIPITIIDDADAYSVSSNGDETIFIILYRPEFLTIQKRINKLSKNNQQLKATKSN
jgi:hypothetical protein